MSRLAQIKQLLALCSPAQRQEVFRYLRHEFALHPLEAQLHTKAEIILEAIQRAGGLTLRMLRGVIAEAAFEVEVVERLEGWKKQPRLGDVAYDFCLQDRKGEVRIQVKLQRSKAGRPMHANEASRFFPADAYVVETQKTRRGLARKTGSPTRPYRFGEFDLLAVALYPSTHRWDAFFYTVANWLIPSPTNPAEMLKFQPVAASPDEDWTDDFQTAVKWLRSRKRKKIRPGSVP
jgi:hypothetical protein